MDKLEQLEQKELLRQAGERANREANGHVPPEHIITGQCSFGALNRYLTLHPIETIRSIEAIKMIAWMYPMLKGQMTDNPAWDLRDILGDDPGKQGE